MAQITGRQYETREVAEAAAEYENSEESALMGEGSELHRYVAEWSISRGCYVVVRYPAS